jgi:hypothetical protein
MMARISLTTGFVSICPMILIRTVNFTGKSPTKTLMYYETACWFRVIRKGANLSIIKIALMLLPNTVLNVGRFWQTNIR